LRFDQLTEMLRLPVDYAGGLHGAGHGPGNHPKDDSQAGIVTTDGFRWIEHLTTNCFGPIPHPPVYSAFSDG